MSNIIYLGDKYRIQTINMTRNHIKKLKATNNNGSNDNTIALNEGALRSFYAESIGSEAGSQELAA